MPELSQQELEELVDGKPARSKAVFYEKARLNVLESKAQNRRVYDTIVYLKETQAGVTDWTAVKVRPEHKIKFPEEWDHFLNTKQGVVSPSISMIPNISPAEMQELYDYGLGTIKLLSGAQHVPPHLEHIHRTAQTIQSVFMETQNVSIEEDHSKESRIEEAIDHTESRDLRRIESGKKEDESGFAEADFFGTGNVPTEDRCDQLPDVRRSAIPESPAIRGGKTSEGLRPDRRVNDFKGVSSDWKISFGI